MIKESVRRELNDISDYDKYYSYSFWCHNCGKKNDVYIQRGEKVKIQTVVCENCGVRIQ